MQPAYFFRNGFVVSFFQQPNRKEEWQREKRILSLVLAAALPDEALPTLNSVTGLPGLDANATYKPYCIWHD